MVNTIKHTAQFLNCPKIKVYRYIKFNRIKEMFIEGNRNDCRLNSTSF
jgi:hypothetical protein